MHIAVADETLKLNPAGWEAAYPGEALYFFTWRNAETAINALENTAVSILIVRHDMLDVAQICSLIEYLEAEANSSARSQIDTIMVIGPSWDDAYPLITRLCTIGVYKVIYHPLSRDLFEAPEATESTPA